MGSEGQPGALAFSRAAGGAAGRPALHPRRSTEEKPTGPRALRMHPLDQPCPPPESTERGAGLQPEPPATAEARGKPGAGLRLSECHFGSGGNSCRVRFRPHSLAGDLSYGSRIGGDVGPQLEPEG